MTANHQDEASIFRSFRAVCTQPLAYQPPSAAGILAAESRLGFRFPSSYLRFLSQCSDRTIQAWDLYRIFDDADPPSHPDDIVSMNTFNQTGGLPRTLIAFWGIGNGDFDCFDSCTPSQGDEYRIVHWQHDADRDEPPLRVADSFLEWLSGQVRDRSRES